MDNQSVNNFNIIQNSNKEMLDYFNSVFIETLESIQEFKTQVFEIDIKIDELEKTRNLYAFKSSSRKSVFTPTTSDDFDNERSKIIDNQINDLVSVKESLYSKIASLEHTLKTVKKRITHLSGAEAAIKELGAQIAPDTLSGSNSNEDVDFEFIQEPSDKSNANHGYNILMQAAFDQSFYATLIDRNLKDNIVAINHKLDMLSYLLSTDVNRARLTIQELSQTSKKLIDSVEDISSKLDYKQDSSLPICTILDEFIMQQRDKHPECIIDTDIECADYELLYHPVFTINLIKLLNIFFDNIYKHSNANSINLRICLTKNKVDANLTDNGIGINSDYLSNSPWYSSLHKAHETIYLLGGTINISGDLSCGTTIKFNFPVME